MSRVMINSLILILLIFSPLGLFSEDVMTKAEKFYNGLGSVIERNMNSPDKCIKEVNAYFAKNQETVNQIRKASEGAMAKMGPMLSNFSSMDEAELAKMRKNSEETASANSNLNAKGFNRIIEEFSQKHPQAGMQIAMKLMELVPMFDKGQFNQLMNLNQ